MIILGIDLGKARTGVAICDRGELLASPLTVVNEHNRERLVERLAALAQKNRAELLAVGLPRNMDGTEGESAKNARKIGALLEEAASLPVAFVDERGTTVTAHGYLNETNTRGKRRKAVVDAVAATVILQNYLKNYKTGLHLSENTVYLFQIGFVLARVAAQGGVDHGYLSDCHRFHRGPDPRAHPAAGRPGNPPLLHDGGQDLPQHPRRR